MESFAGFLSHTDEQLGRLLSHLETLGVLDDTLLLLCSDNGTSAEGGPYGSINEHRFTMTSSTIPRRRSAARRSRRVRAYNHYPWGWAWAGNTPCGSGSATRGSAGAHAARRTLARSGR